MSVILRINSGKPLAFTQSGMTQALIHSGTVQAPTHSGMAGEHAGSIAPNTNGLGPTVVVLT